MLACTGPGQAQFKPTMCCLHQAKLIGSGPVPKNQISRMSRVRTEESLVNSMSCCLFPRIGNRKGTTKKTCDKDFAECSGEFSGAICLK